MPENDIPLTGEPRFDAALVRIREKFGELYDAWIVQGTLERRQSALLKEHSESLVLIEGKLAEVTTNLAEITGKLNLMIDGEMRREGGPEAR